MADPQGSMDNLIELSPHESALRSIWARAHGQEYQAFPSLDEAGKHPHAAMIMEADSGGQILVSCPVSLICATEQALRLLLCDLENVSWGGGFDANQHEPSDESGIYYEPLPPASGIAGGMGGGAVTDGIWVHRWLDAELMLREQIEAIILGKQARLTLPHGFPHCELPSFEVASRYPNARVILYSGRLAEVMVDCCVRPVRCSEATLWELLRELDGIYGEPKLGSRAPDPRNPDRLIFRIGRETDEIFINQYWKVVKWRPQIEAVVEGQHPRVRLS
jgi:hypothetical protein